MYFSLLIDLSSNYINIGIINNNKVLDSFSRVTAKNMIEHVIEDIDNLLKKTSINKKNITKIYWVYGPGLYTGMRVGSLIVKAWAIFNQELEVYVIDKLQYQASNNCISLVDAKGSNYYFATYKDGNCSSEIKLVNEEQLNILITENNLEIIKDKQIYINELKNLNILLNKFTKININNYEMKYFKKSC